MAKTRFTGKGAVVKVNLSGGNTYNTVGVIRSITTPAQEKAEVDVTGMEDNTAQIEFGIEELSRFEFVELHDSADTTDTGVTNLYSNSAERTWQILWTNGTITWTKSFTGKVAKLVPAQVTGKDAITRTVSVVRTGAITDAQA